MPDRTKDGPKARNDQMAQNIRKELHLLPAEEISKSKSSSLAPSCFTLSPSELDQMFKCLRGVRFPLGYAGLISRYLDPNKKNFSGMNSHDCHVMMT
jgi:hypothetical protein